jgi:hypothetical protein
MKTMFGMLKVALGVAVLAALFAQLAGAQCVSLEALKRNTSLLRRPFLTNPFTPAAFSTAASEGDGYLPNYNVDGIVGLWRVNLISEGNNESAGIPDGTVLDSQLAQWHSDGTEIINSNRPPDTGQFCLGVWESVGPSKYKLNHFPRAWNADQTYLGPANIREEVTLSSDHNSYTGTFTLGQYDPQGNLLPPGLLYGKVQATRVTVQSTINDVL